MITPRLSYTRKFYLSEKFYKKVSARFAKDIEDYCNASGILYKTEEAFIAAKKPVEYI